MRVLVIGGCGFLGSHVCEHFLKKGWEVGAYDNMTKFEVSRIAFGDQERIRNYNRDFVKGLGAQVLVADVRDTDALAMWGTLSDYIINCAAQPTMTLSSESPVLDFETNVTGTINILELARKEQIPVASCSSIHVYGTGINDSLVEGEDMYLRWPGLIDENHPVLTGELTPLHASKRAAEIYLQTYTDTYDMRIANFRLTGIYGPRQFGSEDHGWVSLLAIKTMLGLPIQLIGNGKQVRDILYVKDAVAAFDRWFDAGCPPGTYNIGGGLTCMISVLQCLDYLSNLYETPQCIIPGGARRGDLLYFACDCAKALKAFDWQPEVEPAVGLEKLTRWLSNNRDIFAKEVKA